MNQKIKANAPLTKNGLRFAKMRKTRYRSDSAHFLTLRYVHFLNAKFAEASPRLTYQFRRVLDECPQILQFKPCISGTNLTQESAFRLFETRLIKDR